jgi:hypothetical protein
VLASSGVGQACACGCRSRVCVFCTKLVLFSLMIGALYILRKYVSFGFKQICTINEASHGPSILGCQIEASDLRMSHRGFMSLVLWTEPPGKDVSLPIRLNVNCLFLQQVQDGQSLTP